MRRVREPNTLRSRDLTERQAKFVAEYLRNGGNGRQAALTAGYSAPTAHATASTLLTHPAIRARVLAEREKLIESAGVDANWVLYELLDIYRAVPEELIDEETGAVMPIHRMPRNVQKMIQAVEVREEFDRDGRLTGYTKKLRFYSRKDILDQIGKHVRVNAFKDSAGTGDVPSYEDSVRIVLEKLAELKQSRERRTIDAVATPA